MSVTRFLSLNMWQLWVWPGSIAVYVTVMSVTRCYCSTADSYECDQVSIAVPLTVMSVARFYFCSADNYECHQVLLLYRRQLWVWPGSIALKLKFMSVTRFYCCTCDSYECDQVYCCACDNYECDQVLLLYCWQLSVWPGSIAVHVTIMSVTWFYRSKAENYECDQVFIALKLKIMSVTRFLSLYRWQL